MLPSVPLSKTHQPDFSSTTQPGFSSASQPRLSIKVRDSSSDLQAGSSFEYQPYSSNKSQYDLQLAITMAHQRALSNPAQDRSSKRLLHSFNNESQPPFSMKQESHAKHFRAFYKVQTIRVFMLYSVGLIFSII